MIIYNSMIVWIVVLGIWNKLTMQNRWKTQRFAQKQRDYKVPMYLAVLTFGYIIFWVGMRSGVADTRAYISMFESQSTSLSAIPQYWEFSENKSPGFVTFNILFKHFISIDYHVWLMTIAILSGVPIMLILRKKSEHFFYSSFLFMTGIIFFWMLNGMRQFWAATIVFLFSDWIEERKTIPFIIVVLLASTIHFTVLVMIPMYFIAIAKPFGKKVMIFLMLLLLAVVFLEPFVGAMEDVLSETAYSGSTEQFAQDDGVNPIRVLVMAVPPVIAFWGRKILERKENTFINICINMSVICAGIYFLGIFTSGILVGRLPIYFEIYNMILLPYLLKECFAEESSKIMFVLCTIGFLGFYYLQMKNSYYVSEFTGILSGWRG